MPHGRQMNALRTAARDAGIGDGWLVVVVTEDSLSCAGVLARIGTEPLAEPSLGVLLIRLARESSGTSTTKAGGQRASIIGPDQSCIAITDSSALGADSVVPVFANGVLVLNPTSHAVYSTRGVDRLERIPSVVALFQGKTR